MAETYGIFDIRKTPVDLLATLACGLREDSRIRVKLSNMNATPDMLMYATMVDRLSLIAWLNSRDGAKGKNRPKSMLEMIMGAKERNEMVFASGKDFEEYRKQFEDKYVTENDRQGVCPDPTDDDRDRREDAKPPKTGGGKGRRRRRRKRRR